MVKHAAWLAALAAMALIGWFSRPVSDPDFWWHLKTGQYLWETHRLPIPDPFSYTSDTGSPAYPGEEITRRFNLTHEWLAQAILYLTYRAAGFPGVVALRAVLLAAFCGIAGLLVYRRCGHFYRALGAALAVGAVAHDFATDRPFLFTFLFLALTVLILESRKRLWLLPPVFVLWANSHGGFFLGWVALGAYVAEALVRRHNHKPSPSDRALLIAAAASLAASGLNPNGYRIVHVLLLYRQSFLTGRLLEWGRPPLWPPTPFLVLLFAAAGILIWQRRRVRIADWLLFAAFTAAALTASRNTILIGWIAPLAIFSYLPGTRRKAPAWVAAPAALLLVAALFTGSFQFRIDAWRWPSGAADFILANNINGRIFNTYEFGGYFIWRLWPRQRVFIDGRALNESVFQDYARILYNHDSSDGRKSARELLEQYRVQAIVMNGFEYTGGLAYLLAPALGDPSESEWKLVYGDAQAIVFVRQPLPGMPVQPPLRVFEHLEAQCSVHLEHEPRYPRCARALGQMFSQIHDFGRARVWLTRYLELNTAPDPEARQAWQRLVSSGY